MTDAELIAAALAGRPDSVAALARRHTARVRAAVYPIVLNHADADDVTQETLVKAVSSLASFKSGAAFSTWLHRVAVNTALNFLRRKKRFPETGNEDAFSNIEDTTAPTPSENLESAELDAAITRAMQKLPPKQRLAVSLVIIRDLDECEAATIAGCHPATLRWRLHAARQKLKSLLRDVRRDT